MIPALRTNSGLELLANLPLAREKVKRNATSANSLKHMIH
jgi:hypothetical protein